MAPFGNNQIAQAGFGRDIGPAKIGMDTIPICRRRQCGQGIFLFHPETSAGKKLRPVDADHAACRPEFQS